MRESTDLIERLCIEAALAHTGDNARPRPRSWVFRGSRSIPSCTAMVLATSSARSTECQPGLTLLGVRHSLARDAFARNPVPSAHASTARRARASEAAHVVSADVGVRLRRGIVGNRGRRALAVPRRGVALTGPLVCGTSQAVNDWYDRHVDAINEPGRPIPSGAYSGPLGAGDRGRGDDRLARCGGRDRTLGVRRDRARADPRLGPTARRRSG